MLGFLEMFRSEARTRATAGGCFLMVFGVAKAAVFPLDLCSKSWANQSPSEIDFATFHDCRMKNLLVQSHLSLCYQMRYQMKDIQVHPASKAQGRSLQMRTSQTLLGLGSLARYLPSCGRFHRTDDQPQDSQVPFSVLHWCLLVDFRAFKRLSSRIPTPGNAWNVSLPMIAMEPKMGVSHQWNARIESDS